MCVCVCLGGGGQVIPRGKNYWTFQLMLNQMSVLKFVSDFFGRIRGIRWRLVAFQSFWSLKISIELNYRLNESSHQFACWTGKLIASQPYQKGFLGRYQIITKIMLIDINITHDKTFEALF